MLSIEDIDKIKVTTPGGMPCYIKVCELSNGTRALDIRLYTTAQSGFDFERPTKKGVFLFANLAFMNDLIQTLQNVKKHFE